MSVFLRVAYDGTHFSGFARQNGRNKTGEPLRTIQGTLDQVLSRLYKHDVHTRGASRTDAGVHAEGQLVAFEPPFHIPLAGLQKGLWALLPPDITVVAAWAQSGFADLRRDNDGKHYRYRIRTAPAPQPFCGRFEWHLARALDVPAMVTAAQYFVGEHDFAGFRARSCQAQTTIRKVTEIGVEVHRDGLGPPSDPGRVISQAQQHELIDIHVHGLAFLQNMVRIMVGTLVEVGLRRRDPGCVETLLLQRRRELSGRTAPACGLTLVEVRWKPIFDSHFL